MNSTSFGEYLYAGGFIQKTALGPLSYTPNKQTDGNKWFNLRKLRNTTLESSRRHYTKPWANWAHSGLAGPLGRPPGPVRGPLTLHRLVLLPMIYTINSKAVLDQFIQRWSREVMWIDDVAIPCPLLRLPYIYQPLPPSQELSLKP
jgi:hypothetical protein